MSHRADLSLFLQAELHSSDNSFEHSESKESIIEFSKPQITGNALIKTPWL
jgi:hypothetical protein